MNIGTGGPGLLTSVLLLEILLEFTLTKNTTLNFFTKREVSVEIDFERVLFIFVSLLIISAISPRWCPVQELSLKTAPPLRSLPQTLLTMRVEDTHQGLH